jgi:5-methylcytosine-specific restriction endonuclease McrA
MNVKICKGCKEEKSLLEFNKGSGTFEKHTYCKKCQSAQYKEWREKNRDADLERQRLWKQENKEHHQKESIRWRKENPDSWKEIRKRYMYKRKGGGILPNGAFGILVSMYGSFCGKCKTKTDLTVDHVVPISLGGKSNIENLQILCRSCNSSKSNRSSSDYRKM